MTIWGGEKIDESHPLAASCSNPIATTSANGEEIQSNEVIKIYMQSFHGYI